MLILVPNGIDDFDKRVMARNLISKLMACKYKKLVEERIKYWNDRYFQKDVKGVTLRYNSTNWGSCSTTSKINISTRSLLLPMEVFDYILVHELSHLVEMNHSGPILESSGTRNARLRKRQKSGSRKCDEAGFLNFLIGRFNHLNINQLKLADSFMVLCKRMFKQILLFLQLESIRYKLKWNRFLCLKNKYYFRSKSLSFHNNQKSELIYI